MEWKQAKFTLALSGVVGLFCGGYLKAREIRYPKIVGEIIY
jgi:hypothetical protein